MVAEIEAEQALVAANRDLIARFEAKIETAIARVWGGAEDTATVAVPGAIDMQDSVQEKAAAFT